MKWSRMSAAAALLVPSLVVLADVGSARAHSGNSSPTVVHACVGRIGGIVRIVNVNQECHRSETPIHWPSAASGLASLDDLRGLPCITVDGKPTTVKLVFSGPFAMLACAVAQSGRFFDLGLTVYDTHTGLQWEKKVAGSGCLHCVNATYTWCAATGNGGVGSLAECSENRTSWIAQVNTEQFAGHSNWRLPTHAELSTFFTASTICSSDPIFGPNAPAEYWSTTVGDVVPTSQGCLSGGGSPALTLLPVRAVRQGGL